MTETERIEEIVKLSIQIIRHLLELDSSGPKTIQSFGQTTLNMLSNIGATAEQEQRFKIILTETVEKARKFQEEHELMYHNIGDD